MRKTDRLWEGVSALGVAGLFVIFVVVLVGVVFRYVLNSPLQWTDELARYAMIWMIFLSAAVTMQRGEGITVTWFRERMKGWVAAVAAVIDLAFRVVVPVVILVWGTIWALKFTEPTTPALGLPYAVVYAVIPLGGLLMLLGLPASLRRRR